MVANQTFFSPVLGVELGAPAGPVVKQNVEKEEWNNSNSNSAGAPDTHAVVQRQRPCGFSEIQCMSGMVANALKKMDLLEVTYWKSHIALHKKR